MKTVLKYDGSFKGFLTCIFNIYEEKLEVSNIMPIGEAQEELFSEAAEVITHDFKAQRVIKGLKAKISGSTLIKIKWAFLSELPGIEYTLYQFIRYIFSTKRKVDTDYTHHAVLQTANIAKQVGREKHRMEAFVRFRLTKDDIYFAIIEPDFNVLPIISRHFKSRYADQKWLIYDIRRKFGIYYDMMKTEYVSMELPADIGILDANEAYFDESEIYFQKLWRAYFNNTNIKNRANMRLHIQHVPKRYWKYLSEKSPFA